MSKVADYQQKLQVLKAMLETLPDYAISKEYDEMINQLIDAALLAQLEPGWIKVSSDSMPRHDKTVLLVVEQYDRIARKTYRKVIRGCHLESGIEEAWDDYDDTTYSEEDDAYYINEGWFEQIDFWEDYQYAKIDINWTVTHWQELPSLPKDGEQNDG